MEVDGYVDFLSYGLVIVFEFGDVGKGFYDGSFDVDRVKDNVEYECV